MKEKSFVGYLVLNWKTNQVKAIKKHRNRKDKSPFEIYVPYNIKIKIPEIADNKGIVIDTELPIIDTSEIKF